MNSKINAFLRYGYLPQGGGTISSFPFDVDILSDSQSSELENYSEAQLIESGSNLLHNALTTVQEFGDKTHIVPLSGGLDSRAILGGLLESELQGEIVTITFGSPSSFDYKIGNTVGRSVDVKHRNINLTEIKITREKLLEIAKTVPNWTFLFDAFYNRIINKEFGKDCIYWVGFMGDPLAGSHLDKKPTSSFNEAKLKFDQKNRLPKVDTYTQNEYNPHRLLPENPLVDARELSYLEQLDFSIRQTQYIKPTIIASGYEYRTPFLDEDWIQFILSVPRSYRKNQYLYNKILINLWPDLFSLPTETNYGLPLTASKYQVTVKKLINAGISRGRSYLPWLPWPPKQGINYIDFDEAIRSRDDYQSVVRSCLIELDQREVVEWVDIDSLWRTHQSGKQNLAYPLLLLTALELNLKAEEL